MTDFKVPGLDAACQETGLSAGTVKVHAARIAGALTGTSPGGFHVIDACRLDNEGIVPCLDESVTRATRQLSYVALVPAAGAASRFLEPFVALVTALKSGDRQAIVGEVRAFRGISAGWPLPRMVRDFISEVDGSGEAGSAGLWGSIVKLLERPKALFPFSSRMEPEFTFLAAKVREHAALFATGEPIAGEVYVAAPGYTKEFELGLAHGPGRMPALVLEQGGSLSTLRFGASGNVLRDHDGRPASVPAGHGALQELFPLIRDRFPAGEFLLIRNVDNVCGVDPQVIGSVVAFTRTASALIAAVKDVRAWLSQVAELPAHVSAIPDALTASFRTLSSLRPAGGATASADVDPAQILLGFQRNVFHSPDAANVREAMSRSELHRLLEQLYSRPANVLGQVPNSGKDVGGTPAFVRRQDGIEEKLCIEVGHVPAGQLETILKDPRRATHFNPVFVAAELPDAKTGSASREHPYWSVVKKRFAGQDAFYHESFLYEILGSSSLANVVFVEIPRLLFNPHKTLSDKAEHPVVF